MNAFEIGNWLAALVTGLLLTWALALWGHKLPKQVHADDVIRLAVVVFCVAAPLYVTPRFHDWGQDILKFFRSGAFGVTPNATVVNVAAFIIVVIAAGSYLQRSSFWRMVALIIVSLPFFSNDTMHTIGQWWVNHLGSWLFREIIHGLNILAGFH